VNQRPIFGPTTWDLVEAFFEAQRQYQRVYSNYETRVLAHAEQQAVDRHQLRLEAEEVSKLLDFERLGELRSGPLERTKEISHALFRSKGRTHKFDRYVSEVFHELSILREEQYKVSTFAETYRRENELAAYESILDEVHEDFPRRVNNIWGLFQRAQLSLEAVLRTRTRDPIYLRSLFLFGDELFQSHYRRGRTGHCWRVFDCGPAEADLMAARSLAHAGFRAKALQALDQAIQAADAGIPAYAGEGRDAARLEKIGVDARALKEFVERRETLELVKIDSLALSGEAPALGSEGSLSGIDPDQQVELSSQASDVGRI
jgi:hypothetical protein